ncbi:MAG: SRPBCC domain-containing protein, partial [Fibrobacteria bacterium]
NGMTLEVCDVDLRVGGAYRYVWRGPGGFEMGMGGVYKEIVPAERIVSTEKFDQSWYPGGAVGTVVFTEKDGRTTVTTDILYDTKDARDAVLKSPMDQGMEAGYQALAALLSTLRMESGVAA